MLCPGISARVKQPDDSPGFGIAPGNVWSFVAVAGKTSQRQIPRHRLPAMFASQNMINLKWKFVVFGRHPAVFTSSLSAPPDQIF
jgi:hypothetical protein